MSSLRLLFCVFTAVIKLRMSTSSVNGNDDDDDDEIRHLYTVSTLIKPNVFIITLKVVNKFK